MQGVRGDLSARSAVRLQSASARSRSPTTTRALDPAEAKRRIQAGSRGIWRYADFLPFESRPADPLEPGLTPLVRADRLAERLGLEAEVWIKNDAANPTHSFKDRVVAVAIAKARELGFETVACASTGNLANAVAAHAAAAGLDSYVFVPADLEEQKLLATGVYGTKLVGVRGNYDDVNRLCTQLAEDAALGLRQRQPPPLLRRGLEDDRLRDRRAARLGAARPRRRPDRLRARCSRRSAAASTEWLELGLVDGRAAGLHGAQAPAATRSRPPSPRAGTSASRRSRTRSPRAWRSATRPTAPTRSSWRARAAARSTPSPTRRSATASGCWPRPPGSSPRPPAASPSRRSRSSPSGARSARGERVVVCITGEGLKTLDAARDRFHMHEIDPDLGQLRVRVHPGGSRLMAVKVKIPTQLRAATGGESELEVEGATVGEALDAVFDQHDGLRERITQDGDLRRFVNVYVSGEDIRFTDGLETEVSDGDEVTILPRSRAAGDRGRGSPTLLSRDMKPRGGLPRR